MERTNIRYVRPEDIGESLDFVSIDVAFISLTKVLGAVRPLLKAQGEIVALIKPQFEAGREHVGKKGVVRDAGTHEQVIREIVTFSRLLSLTALGMTYSPVKGPEGNIEYLLYLTTDMARSDTVTDEIIGQTVAEAHRILN